MLAVHSLLVTTALVSSIAATQPAAVLHGCDLAVTPIHAIQGEGSTSPLLEQQLTVRGVVTASWQADEELGGFYLHSLEHDSDDNPLTSEGLFVQTNSNFPQVMVGKVIVVRGNVNEIQQVTSLSNATMLEYCGEQQPPSPYPLRLPVASLAVFESLENMPVRFEQTLVVTGHFPLARYGQFQLAVSQQYTATQLNTPGAAAHAANQQALLGRIAVDDNRAEKPTEIIYPSPQLSASNSLRSGDSVSDLQGIVSEFNGNYQVQPLQQPTFINTNPRPPAPAQPAQQTIRIAAFNVLNYFNGEGVEKQFPTRRGAKTAADFARQEAKIVAALAALKADVIGLMEIENDGYQSDSAIVQLTNALREYSGEDWQFINAAQELDNGRLGGDAITNGLLYRGDRVRPHSAAITSRQAPFGSRSRPPLVQQFYTLQNHQLFAVAVNHFKSKGSCPRDNNRANADQGDGQGCWNPVRVESSQKLVELMQSAPLDQLEHSIVLGDFNAYAMEDPITVLKQNGFHNLIEQFEPLGYSYVFNGFAGSLDHILVSTALRDRVTDQRHWSINADEPTALQYAMYRINPAWVDASPYRASDHDPVYVDVQF